MSVYCIAPKKCKVVANPKYFVRRLAGSISDPIDMLTPYYRSKGYPFKGEWKLNVRNYEKDSENELIYEIGFYGKDSETAQDIYQGHTPTELFRDNKNALKDRLCYRFQFVERALSIIENELCMARQAPGNWYPQIDKRYPDYSPFWKSRLWSCGDVLKDHHYISFTFGTHVDDKDGLKDGLPNPKNPKGWAQITYTRSYKSNDPLTENKLTASKLSSSIADSIQKVFSEWRDMDWPSFVKPNHIDEIDVDSFFKISHRC
jgi:hypothetical protein